MAETDLNTARRDLSKGTFLQLVFKPMTTRCFSTPVRGGFGPTSTAPLRTPFPPPAASAVAAKARGGRTGGDISHNSEFCSSRVN